MRHPDKVPYLGLLDIVLQIREAMYWDPDIDDWNRDKEVNGGDLVELVHDLLESYNLVPDHSEAFEDCKCARCEAARVKPGDTDGSAS